MNLWPLPQRFWTNCRYPQPGIQINTFFDIDIDIAQFNIESDERLLIGAHWDTRAVADEDPNLENQSIPILGANDGASGTAILMELANVFSENNPPVGIDLVFLMLKMLVYLGNQPHMQWVQNIFQKIFL